LNYGPLPLM